MMRSNFPSLTTLPRVQCPVLILHGQNDTTIPASMAQQLFAVAPEPKQLWLVPEAGHANLLALTGQLYPRRIRDFLQGHPP